MSDRRVGEHGSAHSGAHELVALVPLLCDPASREPLHPREEHGQSFLVSSPSGRRFPIRDGIPCFLEDADSTGSRGRYRRLFDRIARLLDLSTWLHAGLAQPRDSARRRESLRRLEIREGSRVLEVSVGTGANLGLLPPNTWYFGLDASWERLRRCRQRGARHGLAPELFQGAAESLPFRDGVFDSVFHLGGMRFFSDRARAVAEMVRVAKPATRIIIVDETGDHGDRSEGIKTPTDLLPPGMREVETRLLAGWESHCLSFRTPPERVGTSHRAVGGMDNSAPLA